MEEHDGHHEKSLQAWCVQRDWSVYFLVGHTAFVASPTTKELRRKGRVGHSGYYKPTSKGKPRRHFHGGGFSFFLIFEQNNLEE